MEKPSGIRRNDCKDGKTRNLTEKGVQNAILLGERLEEIEFETIYSSPSTRTMMTAELIKGKRVQPIYPEDHLREIHLGDWEGQKHDVLEEMYPEEYHAFWHAPHLFKANTGETFEQLQERVQNVLVRIQSENTAGNILVVTHTVFIKSLLAFCKRLSLEEFWSPPFIHDTSLTIIEIENGQCEVKVEGNIDHLGNSLAK